MNHEKLREQVHAGIDRRCATLTADPARVQRVLQAAKGQPAEKRGMPVGRKLSLTLALALAATLLAATAVAAMLLTMRGLVEEHALPMAQQQEGDAYPPEDVEALLHLAEENGIYLSPEGLVRIAYALQQGDGYYKDELIREFAKAEFGPDPLLWSLEEQQWYADTCRVLGLADGIEPLLPDSSEAEAAAIRRAQSCIEESSGIVPDEAHYLIGVQYALGTDEIDFPGPCWTVRFLPKSIEYAEYTVYLDDGGALLHLLGRPGLSADSTVDDIYHLYWTVYGAKREWSQATLISFRETLLRSSDTGHQAYLCMLQTDYPVAPAAGALTGDEAVALAADYLQADSFIQGGVHLISTAGNPVWKFWLNTGTARYSFEVDCVTGEFVTLREIGPGDSKWWMDLVLWEVSDEVQESWVDSSPAFG